MSILRLVANLIVLTPLHVRDDMLAVEVDTADASLPTNSVDVRPMAEPLNTANHEWPITDLLQLRLHPGVEPVSIHTLSVQDNLPDVAPDVPPAYGSTDSWRWKWLGVLGLHSSHDTFSGAGFGIEHFFQEAGSIQLQVSGVYVAQRDTDAAGASADLLWRWHFVHEAEWSVFLEGGIGVMWTSNDVPANGSHLNFAPQASLGMSTALTEGARLEVTAGYHHLSNGGLFPTNPSRDSLRITVGVSVPF